MSIKHLSIPSTSTSNMSLFFFSVLLYHDDCWRDFFFFVPILFFFHARCPRLMNLLKFCFFFFTTRNLFIYFLYMLLTHAFTLSFLQTHFANHSLFFLCSASFFFSYRFFFLFSYCFFFLYFVIQIDVVRSRCTSSSNTCHCK